MGLLPEEIKAASAKGIEKAEQVEDTNLRENLDEEMHQRGQ